MDAQRHRDLLHYGVKLVCEGILELRAAARSDRIPSQTKRGLPLVKLDERMKILQRNPAHG
jgi:hypothetical protein